LWGGDFRFPEGTSLISGVFCISISSSTQLDKPINVQLQHCADISNEIQAQYLSFIIANSEKPPYQFELVPGGIFKEHSQYGIMSIKRSVSIIAIVKKVDDTTDAILNSNYCVHIFNECISSIKEFRISLVAFQDLEYFSQQKARSFS
jgi:hypothetical protein